MCRLAKFPGASPLHPPGLAGVLLAADTSTLNNLIWTTHKVLQQPSPLTNDPVKSHSISR